MLAAASEGTGEKVDAGRGFRDPWEKGFVLSMGSWGLRDTASGTGTTIIIPIYRHGNGGTDGVGTGEPRHPVQHTLTSPLMLQCLRKGPGRYRQGAFSAAGMITAEGLSQLPCPSPACRLLRCPPPTPTLPRAFLRTQLLASTWERCQGSVPLPNDLARSQSLN